VPPPRAPRALIRGAKSKLFKADDAEYLMTFVPPGTPHVVIPEAEHH